MTPSSSAADSVADRLSAAHSSLALKWLERLAGLLPVPPEDVFPSDHLLDHIPTLIVEIADHLRMPAEHQIVASTAVMSKAAELALLRLEQQASVHQLLREYELLGDVLDEFMRNEVKDYAGSDVAEFILIQQRLSRAVQTLQRHTVDTFLTKYIETIDRQAAQMRGFNRLVSHELRQPLGVLSLLARVIPASVKAEGLPPLVETLDRNVRRVAEIVGKLERLARVDGTPDTPVTQVIHLDALVRDVADQLVEMAQARGVAIEIESLPEVRLEPARVELVFLNLLANAVKYSDPDKPERWVRVRRQDDRDGLRIAVADNGIGVPRERLASIFEAFVRAHSDRDGELKTHGLGLGLTIVRDAMEALRGSVTVESTEGAGTTFSLRWPLEVIADVSPSE
jgi:signal transduction histidine kinase